ncbi:hypothetical protein ACF09C_26025 [Streptomyces sp. NPDC014870]|uniref:hypothetical protein n=1 Tax=Streptomyces sp. NPDC014870 TaxID=3364925 RepID=UPI0036FBF3E8
MTTSLAALALAAGSLGSLPLTLAAAGPAAADVVEPFGKRYDASLHGDFTTIGNTVMGCPTAPADLAARCATAASGQGGDNNNTFVMRRINTASMDAGYGSSTGHVVVPAGARVAYARLFWGGNDGTYKGPSGAQLKRCDISGADVTTSPGDHATTSPHIRVGSGAATPVSIDSLVTDPADTNGPHYYTGESDVTAAFAGVTGTDAQVAVGNIWAPDGKGCVAGWSLTVVYAFPGPEPTHAPDRRAVYVYGGHVLQRSSSPATTVTVDGFHRTTGRARASVTAYEGDWNTPGDRFLVDGRNVTEAHTGNTSNFFVSEDDGAVSPKLRNNLSIDAKAFDIPEGAIPVGARSAELTFTTTGDTYVPSALAFSVPVPDLEIPVRGDGKLLNSVEVESPRSNCGKGSEDPACAVTPVVEPPKPEPSPSPSRTSPKPTPSDPVNPSPSPSRSSSPSPSESDTTPSPAPTTHQPRPTPHEPAGPHEPGGPHGPGGSMAETGSSGERLWLLGGLALALAATGLVAKAALRGRRDH